VDEVLAGLLTGRPPKRWAHVYTGNHSPCSSLFHPALPALPSVPSTALARVLVGTDEFALCPHAIDWLFDGGAALHEAVLAHRRVMCNEMLSGLRQRLRRLARMRSENDLVAGQASSTMPYLTGSTPAAVPAAARAAVADADLWSRKKRARLGVQQQNQKQA